MKALARYLIRKYIYIVFLWWFILPIVEEKPPHQVEASCFINTILSRVGQLGRLGCMGYDEV